MSDDLAAILRDLAWSNAGALPRPDGDAGDWRPGRLWCALCDASNDAGPPWLPPARLAGDHPVVHRAACPWARARILAGLPVAVAG